MAASGQNPDDHRQISTRAQSKAIVPNGETCRDRLSGHSDSSDIHTTIRVQSTRDPVEHRHHVVSVRAEAVRRLENPAAYSRVPRRVVASDGRIRRWTPAEPSTRGTHDPG